MEIIILQQIGTNSTESLWKDQAPNSLVYAGNVSLQARILDIKEEGLFLDNSLFINTSECLYYDLDSLKASLPNFDSISPKIDKNPLWQIFDIDKRELGKKYIVIPIYLRHVIQALINIYPLDPYLAAHYEKQLLNIITKFSSDDEDLLNSLNLSQSFDLIGNDIVDQFLRFQRKLYLTYQRED